MVLINNFDNALRPPMGWNSWDSYGSSLTEGELMSNAEFMAARLKAFGWDTVVVDIDWYDPTAAAHNYNVGAPLVLDEYGRQMPDTGRFPSAADGHGFASIASRVHELGLKFGLHMMRGIPKLAVERNLPVKDTQYTAKDVADLDHVCVWNPDNYGLNQSHPGAQAWYDAQVDQFAAWGVDFLKMDDMQTPFHDDEIEAYHRAIAKAEHVHGHPISLSLSPGQWNNTTYVDFLRGNAQMWRISDDLWDRWDDVYQQFSRLARWAPLQQTGHWADADMLPLGHIGLRAHVGADRDSRLTHDERRTLLTLWAMGRSPLMVGGDLPTSTPETIAMLANPALREVTAGSTHNREVARERIYAQGYDHPESYRGDLIVWAADAADWADGTVSAHPNGRYAAIFWTGDDDYELEGHVELKALVGLDRANEPWCLTDLFEDVKDGGRSSASDGAGSSTHVASIDGEGRDRVIRGVVPSHGVLWFALDNA
nr:glycoside hydrolase family 27 protein [Bifidobacterium bohemicum]